MYLFSPVPRHLHTVQYIVTLLILTPLARRVMYLRLPRTVAPEHSTVIVTTVIVTPVA